LKEDIKSLIPHREPFLFVDDILSVTRDEIIGTKTFDDSFEIFKGHFPECRIVPGTILIESMAQCGGAGLKKIGRMAGRMFALATIDSARFLDVVEYGQTVRMVLKNLRVRDKAFKQSGILYVNDMAAVESVWTCVCMS